MQKKELDIIGGTDNGGKHTYQFYEDWDSRPAGRDSGNREKSRRTAGNARGGAGQRSAGQNTAGKRSAPPNGARQRDASQSAAGPKSDAGPGSARRGNRAQETGGQKGRRQKGRRKKKSLLKKLFVTAAVLLLAVGAGLYLLTGLAYEKMNYSEIPAFSGKPLQEDGVIHILLIGNDSRENGEDGRSDAMILLSVSKKTKSIYMTSLLRDMYVDIPGHEGNRLNAAYSFGGPELLMKTVEQNLDIPVHRYIQVNFEAFASLVDAVDGVDLELTTEEIEYVNGYLVEYNMLTNRPQGTDNMDPSLSGMVHLNGPQALAYCRNRYLGTDFGRTQRQRKVLSEVIRKLPKALILNGGKLADSLLPNLTTNLTKGECFRLGLKAAKFLTYDLVSDNIPQKGTYSDATIRGMAVLEVDFEENKKYLREKLYGEEAGR